MEIGTTFAVQHAHDFAGWLTVNGQEARDIWLILYKKASGKQTVTYQQLVEVALCYGWIDGIMKTLDSEKYAQRFTPRRKGSTWTESNKALARRLLAEGRMTPAGKSVLPADVLPSRPA
ncbi:MAG: hypothetical protein HY689_12710 [Chloroflexi bacterium]|nr:hypothetical protein [Chloroflexota bacterium]